MVHGRRGYRGIMYKPVAHTPSRTSSSALKQPIKWEIDASAIPQLTPQVGSDSPQFPHKTACEMVNSHSQLYRALTRSQSIRNASYLNQVVDRKTMSLSTDIIAPTPPVRGAGGDAGSHPTRCSHSTHTRGNSLEYKYDPVEYYHKWMLRTLNGWYL